jgi:hypothetical protein
MVNPAIRAELANSKFTSQLLDVILSGFHIFLVKTPFVKRVLKTQSASRQPIIKPPPLP